MSKVKLASNVAAADTVFGRDYNEALIHQIVVAYAANARSGNRKQKDREEVHHTTKKPWRQKGTGRARAGMSSSPLWRGGGRIFPNSPDENFTHKVNKKMYRAGICSILSQLAREERLDVIENLSIEAPKTKLLSQKLQGMGLDSVLVITDTIDENLLLASRNLPNVLVVEPKHADPDVAGVLQESPGHQSCSGQDRGDVRMSAAIKFSEERLMKVLLAPVISEKATFVAEKNEQIVFRVLPDATKPEIKAAVELLFKVEVESVQTVEPRRQAKAFGPFHRSSQPHQARFRVPEARPGNQFRRGG